MTDRPTETLLRAVRTVYDTFVRDEAQGYRSKDRQFAIDVLGPALAAHSGEKPQTDEEKSTQLRTEHGDSGATPSTQHGVEHNRADAETSTPHATCDERRRAGDAQRGVRAHRSSAAPQGQADASELTA